MRLQISGTFLRALSEGRAITFCMLPSRQGSFRLFSAFGIQVSLHWSWFLVAYYRFESGRENYQNPAWMLGEYVTLFAIVLLHEFGHSLACRSVGGQSDRIVLWPFGGIAFVQPPHRPGAFLWSIAAGPLVNVALVPVLYGLRFVTALSGLTPAGGDAEYFLASVWQINLILLFFNLLPIYPLDGGQIFQSILWFFTGYARSVIVAGGLGLVLGAGAVIWGFSSGNWWLGLISLFLISQSWRSFQNARQILRYEKEQRQSAVIDI